MKASKFHEMTTAELEQKVSSLKKELFNLRFQMATGQLQNAMVLKECKRDIARAKTILREREIKDAAAAMKA